MAYEVTVNRVMASFEPDEPRNSVLTGKSLGEAFVQQVKSAARNGDIKKLYAGMIAAAGDKGIQLRDVPGHVSFRMVERRPMLADIGIGLKRRSDPDEYSFVARLRPKLFSIQINDRLWLMQAHATITDHALRGEGNPARMWWNFQGVLMDADARNRPEEADAVQFIKATNTLAEIGFSLLRDVYQSTSGTKNALAIKPGRVRIHMADDDRKPFAALIDHLFFPRLKDLILVVDLHGDKPDDPYPEGARLLDSFIQHASGYPISDALPLVRIDDTEHVSRFGLFREIVQGRDVTVAGLSRSRMHRGGYAGQPQDSWCADHQPKYLSWTSAARRLSAILAMRQAERLEAAQMKPKVA